MCQELIERALRAICLTRDYVGEQVLPAEDGWEWYEASKVLAAHSDGEWAEQFRLRVAPAGEAHQMFEEAGVELPPGSEASRHTIPEPS
jgi:hypothetical protein